MAPDCPPAFRPALPALLSNGPLLTRERCQPQVSCPGCCTIGASASKGKSGAPSLSSDDTRGRRRRHGGGKGARSTTRRGSQWQLNSPGHPLLGGARWSSGQVCTAEPVGRGLQCSARPSMQHPFPLLDDPTKNVYLRGGVGHLPSDQTRDTPGHDAPAGPSARAGRESGAAARGRGG